MQKHNTARRLPLAMVIPLLLVTSGCGGARQDSDAVTTEPAVEVSDTPSEPAGGQQPGVEVPVVVEPVVEPPQQPAEAAAVPQEDTEAKRDGGEEGFLPPWWHDEPIARGGRLYACAVAEADSLSAANRAVVATGQNALRAALLERGVTNVEAVLADSRTEAAAADMAGPSRWRGFVEVSVEFAGPG